MLVIPAGYHFFSRNVLVKVTGILTGVALCVEIARFTWPSFSRLFYRVVGRLLRPHESFGLTGSFYLLASAFLCILWFDQWIAMSSLLFLVLSDAFSALVGRKWGRTMIVRDRSIEGSAAFLISAAIIFPLFPEISFPVGAAGITAAILIDLFVTGINDNLSIPLGAGFTMQILTWMLHG